MTVTMFLYELGWGNQRSFGRAAAVAWLLFLIILVIGLINFTITRRIASTGTPDVRAPRARKGARR
jgi:cellobiose transport system permease protein